MEPDITIYCLTYNHVDYIRETLEGFLMQNTEYTYKVFVYDDASTDGTSDILREYENKFSDVFDIYIAEKNIYNAPNRHQFFQKLYREHIIGKYVAWCEGDDCWSSPFKLQLQVEYLEKHSECSMVAHAAEWLDCRTNEVKEYRPYTENKYLSAEEVILQANGNLSTASLVMRREVLIRDEKFPVCDVGDIPMQLCALYQGKIFYFNKIMSKYRYMHNGSWSSEFYGNKENAWKHKLSLAKFYEDYDVYSKYIFHKLIQIKKRECIYFPIINYSQLEFDDIENLALRVNESTIGKYEGWIKSQMEVIRTQRELYYISSAIKEFVDSKQRVIIMGIGNNARCMTLKLKHASININGYVVSDNQKITGNNFDYPIWKLSEYPYEWRNTALVVAIGSQFQEEIESILKEKGIQEYIAPYWLDVS